MTPVPPAAFDPLAMIEVMNRHEVQFVVIGGIAAGVQGAMWATFDLDVTYSRSRENLQRLAAALADLDAAPLGFEPGVKVVLDARALGHGDIWILQTRLGRIDLLGEPAPGLHYEALAPRARTIHGSHTYRVASLPDLIAMKRHAGRPKDSGHLVLLAGVLEASTYAPGREPRGPGGWEGSVSMAENFDDPLPEIVEAIDE